MSPIMKYKSVKKTTVYETLFGLLCAKLHRAVIRTDSNCTSFFCFLCIAFLEIYVQLKFNDLSSVVK